MQFFIVGLNLIKVKVFCMRDCHAETLIRNTEQLQLLMDNVS